MSPAQTIIVATHRRSGTHWTIDALRNNSPDISETFMTLERISIHHDSPLPLVEFRQQLAAQPKRVLMKVHDLPSAGYFGGDEESDYARNLMRSSPIIYVHRDGRDVMVSLYHYMRSFSEVVREQSFSQFLGSNSALDGVQTTMSRPAYWAHHAQIWLGNPNLLSVSYAELESEYDSVLREMADFLQVRLHRSLKTIDLPGASTLPSTFGRVMWKLGVRQKRLSSAVQPRGGSSGDWRSHFDESDIEFFWGEAGQIMQELGYIK